MSRSHWDLDESEVREIMDFRGVEEIGEVSRRYYLTQMTIKHIWLGNIHPWAYKEWKDKNPDLAKQDLRRRKTDRYMPPPPQARVSDQYVEYCMKQLKLPDCQMGETWATTLTLNKDQKEALVVVPGLLQELLALRKQLGKAVVPLRAAAGSQNSSLGNVSGG